MKGWVIGHLGQYVEVENLEGPNSGEVIPCFVKQSLEEVVIGDFVQWQATHDHKGVVVKRLPRESLLVRCTRGNVAKRIAANVSAMAIVWAPKPRPSWFLLDQYLVASAICDCKPILVLNKSDLLEGDSELLEQAEFYQSLGYCVQIVNTLDGGFGIEALCQWLKEHVTVLIGQSGVGKSSLVKVILPHRDIAISGLSVHKHHGRHTTSKSTLYHLPLGGHLIDAPGIRDFKLSGRYDPSQLMRAFPEIAVFMGHCRFRNCTHHHEPDCAIKQAVAESLIRPNRLQNFLRILQEFAV